MCNRSSRMTMNKAMSRLIATADVIATHKGKIVLIERQKYPFGLALPGGHVEHGERPRETAMRELLEETGLVLNDARFFTTRKGSKRDPRYALCRTRVYTGRARGNIRDEAECTHVVLISPTQIRKLPKERFAFDHHRILMAYLTP